MLNQKVERCEMQDEGKKIAASFRRHFMVAPSCDDVLDLGVFSDFLFVGLVLVSRSPLSFAVAMLNIIILAMLSE